MRYQSAIGLPKPKTELFPDIGKATFFPSIVEDAVRSVEGVNDATVDLVWDPPWSRERMSEAARLQLGML
jgi:metal-sulfur cluster biosynthetic enzyme